MHKSVELSFMRNLVVKDPVTEIFIKEVHTYHKLRPKKHRGQEIL